MAHHPHIGAPSTGTTAAQRWCTALLALAWSAAACAQDHAPTLADYNRAVWTASDGAPVHVTRMAQTPDGWLWLGTPNGLYRFDGVRFHRFAPTNDARLLSPRIRELSAQSDGELYIGYETPGLSVIRADGRLEHLAGAARDGPVREISHIVRDDDDGALWVSTAFGLRHLKQGRWATLGPAQACPVAQSAVAFDRGGQLWAATLGQLYRVDRASGRCIPADPLASNAGLPNKMVGFHTSPDGRLWAGADGQLVLVAAPPPSGAVRSAYPGQSSGSSALFDRAGNLWALRCPAGVCMVAGAGSGSGTSGAIDVARAATSRLDQPGQLSSLAPRVIFEDREGDIWLGAPTGIERFRRNILRPVRLPAIKGDFHVAPDPDGGVWLVAPQERRGWRYDPVTRRLADLPGKYRGALAAPDGAIVFLKEDGISLRRAGVDTHIALPGPLPPAAWARSDGERIWLGGFNVPVQLWDGHAWRPSVDLPGAEFVFSAAGRRGQMWRGLADGRLVLFEDGRVRSAYDQQALGMIGEPTCLAAAPELVVCGEAGVTVLRDGRFQRLRTQRDEVLHRVTGILVAADGSRWLNGDTGLLRVEESDWRRAVDAGAPLRYTLLDARDGYTGTAADVASLRMVNGRLWVTTTDGIVELDPPRRARDPLAPRPQLVALTGDEVDYPLTQPPRIRAGTTRLRFDFTAPALGRPERLMFGYRLDGVDHAWQTTAERSATYTALAPGDYRFRLRAMHQDGVWSAREQTLDLQVAPILVQTIYFKLACVAAGLLLLWAGYRIRLRFLTRTLTERLHAQLEERERIARDLHDTVLQTFQGFVMKTTAMLPQTESALGESLRHSLREAKASIMEGRDKVATLRAGAPDQPSLHDYLRMAGEQDAGPGQAFTLRCVGPARRLHPIVEQELCAIGREALRNAFRHAHASQHDVIIEYGASALVLTVRDDGRGMSIGASAGAREKLGHWGLRGIRERARLIHAEARLQSTPGAGTAWRIDIKAALAYADVQARRAWSWNGPRRRGKERHPGPGVEVGARPPA